VNRLPVTTVPKVLPNEQPVLAMVTGRATPLTTDVRPVTGSVAPVNVIPFTLIVCTGTAPAVVGTIVSVKPVAPDARINPACPVPRPATAPETNVPVTLEIVALVTVMVTGPPAVGPLNVTTHVTGLPTTAVPAGRPAAPEGVHAFVTEAGVAGSTTGSSAAAVVVPVGPVTVCDTEVASGAPVTASVNVMVQERVVAGAATVAVTTAVKLAPPTPTTGAATAQPAEVAATVTVVNVPPVMATVSVVAVPPADAGKTSVTVSVQVVAAGVPVHALVATGAASVVFGV